MKQPFDIFWFGETGRNWIEAVDTLEIAKAHIEKLPQVFSGSYAVLDQRTGNRISFAAKIQASATKQTQSSCKMTPTSLADGLRVACTPLLPVPFEALLNSRS